LTVTFTPAQQAEMLQCFGKPFMDALPARLADYAKRWGLAKFSFIEYYSVNCLFLCRSEKHGSCVLKIFGCDYAWYIGEFRMLCELNGKCGYVGVYEHDEEGGALLLERIEPGITLKLEPSLERRTAIFADIWQSARIVPRDPSLYKTYLETAEDITKKLTRSDRTPELQRAALRMESICKDLYGQYSERVLLHADLHGDNLLKDAYGGYRIVDPHARIGPPICDLGRYIANEYEDAEHENRAAVTEAVITQLASALHLPQADIARAFFVDITLMTCWSAEHGAVDLGGALYAESLLG